MSCLPLLLYPRTTTYCAKSTPLHICCTLQHHYMWLDTCWMELRHHQWINHVTSGFITPSPVDQTATTLLPHRLRACKRLGCFSVVPSRPDLPPRDSRYLFVILASSIRSVGQGVTWGLIWGICSFRSDCCTICRRHCTAKCRDIHLVSRCFCTREASVAIANMIGWELPNRIYVRALQVPYLCGLIPHPQRNKYFIGFCTFPAPQD